VSEREPRSTPVTCFVCGEEKLVGAQRNHRHRAKQHVPIEAGNLLNISHNGSAAHVPPSQSFGIWRARLSKEAQALLNRLRIPLVLLQAILKRNRIKIEMESNPRKAKWALGGNLSD
jgi:hypothetical protein